MITHTAFQQHSLEWLSARAGIVTASEVDALVSPTFEIRKGLGVSSYLAQKVAEKWIGGALPGLMDLSMELGNILEEEAIPFYEFEFDQKVSRVALITDDGNRYGCSPDGLIGEEGGIEIKCPEAKNHTRYLLLGKLPQDYATQVHFSMYVTGRKWWKFMSYRRGFPPFLITVERDDKIQSVFKEALDEFLAKLDAAMIRMVEMNGGQQPRKNTFRESILSKPTTAQTNDGEIIP